MKEMKLCNETKTRLKNGRGVMQFFTKMISYFHNTILNNINCKKEAKVFREVIVVHKKLDLPIISDTFLLLSETVYL